MFLNSVDFHNFTNLTGKVFKNLQYAHSSISSYPISILMQTNLKKNYQFGQD